MKEGLITYLLDWQVQKDCLNYSSFKIVVNRDQMHTLFSFLGKIEDLRLYPSLRSAPEYVEKGQVL